MSKYGPFVSGDEFFNRDIEIQRLTGLINENNNILIVAPRRVGKTSLVHETFRRLQKEGLDYLLYVDIQHCSTPEDVIVALSLSACPYKELSDKILDAFKFFWKQIQDNIESIKSDQLLEIKFREGLTGDWQAKGQKIMDNLAQADRPITICFDELPVMITRLLKSANESEYHQKRLTADVFLSWLRKVMNSHQGRLRFIICGSIGLEPILKRHGLSYTITLLRPYNLEPWRRETAEACLNALAKWYDLTLTNEARGAVLDHLGSYIPHHVQMFFGHLYEDCFKRNEKTPSVSDVDRVYAQSMLSTRGHAELADYEERLLRVLEPNSVQLALDLLTEAAVTGSLTLENAGLLAQSVQGRNHDAICREVLDVLQHDGYLEREEGAQSWRFVSRLVKDWWKRRFSRAWSPSGRSSRAT